MFGGLITGRVKKEKNLILEALLQLLCAQHIRLADWPARSKKIINALGWDLTAFTLRDVSLISLAL